MKEGVTFNDVEGIVVPIVWLLLWLFMLGFLIWGSVAAPPDGKLACRYMLIVLSVPGGMLLLIGLITGLCNLRPKHK